LRSFYELNVHFNGFQLSISLKKNGSDLRQVREARGLTQEELARLTGLHRLSVQRIESGRLVPKLDDAIRLAEALKIPLQMLINGRWRPADDLPGIAIELFHLGIRDLALSKVIVPGAFRRSEQVLALALRGDRPEPRIVNAIPFVLARNTFNVRLLRAFADFYDRRLRARLAWLGEVALILHQRGVFDNGLSSEETLASIIRSGKKRPIPDSLGHPREGKAPPAWARWNISYIGGIQDFLQRTLEVQDAFGRSNSFPEAD
jgi:transcriptional regulator with XRE-family HTH domain